MKEIIIYQTPDKKPFRKLVTALHRERLCVKRVQALIRSVLVLFADRQNVNAEGHLKLQRNFGPVCVLTKNDVWRCVGKLPEVFHHVIVICISKLNRYSEPVDVGTLVLKKEGL